VQFAASIVETSHGTPLAAAVPPSPEEPLLEVVPDEAPEDDEEEEPPEDEPAEDEPPVDEPPDDPVPGNDGPPDPGTTITLSSAGEEQAPDTAGRATIAIARRFSVLTDGQ
jgi:hypothetical protein